MITGSSSWGRGMLKFKSSGIAQYLLVLMFVTPSGFADAPRKAGGDQAVRKAQYLLRQLSEEKNKLQTQNNQLETELTELKKKLAKVKKKLGKTNKKLDQSRSSNSQLVERVKSDRDRMQEMLNKYRQAAQMLRIEKSNVALLKNAVGERNNWIDKCKANNDSLYEVNLELLGKYKDKSAWQALKQDEPVTGLGNVKLEVIVDNYRFRIEDLQVADFKKNDEENSPVTSSIQ